MFTRQAISVGNLLLNVRNFRIVAQDNQKSARDAIIAEQGQKLVVLAKDIVANGLSPFDLPMVVDAEDGNKNFIVMEGNRRLTTIQLLLDPELAKDTPVHSAFVKLRKQHADSVPKVIDCAIAANRAQAIMWGNKKHASGLGGAGTEPWTAMAKARADKEQGQATPALDAVNFVLTNQKLDSAVRRHLEGSKFNLSTLERLVTTAELQGAAGISVTNGKLESQKSKEWVQDLLTDVVTIIATGKKSGKKWTEREIDSQEKREAFIHDLTDSRPGNKKASSAWHVSGQPKPVTSTQKAAKTRQTPSTEDQPNLIPKAFKLTLPAGKFNDIFVELKKLDVVAYRHAISVLFRVFFELTIDDYMKRFSVTLPAKDKDTLNNRLRAAIKHAESKGLLTKKELQPVNVAISNANSLLAPTTLNAYVHSPWMNPDPKDLKTTWHNAQLFIERLWGAK